jgi:hypothetical protein
MLERKAARIPANLFRQSAQLALLHSYEDFCRIKNAYLKGDDIVLKDYVHYVTYSAALIVASVNRVGFSTDKEVFKAHRNYRKLPRRFDRIMILRYGDLNRKAFYETLVDFYVNLVTFCKKQGLTFPVPETQLRNLQAA